MRLAAMPLLATSLTNSPFLISAVTAAQYLPWTTFAPFGGVIVDRSDRRRLIMATQAWRATIMALLALIVLTDAASVWMLMVVAFLITVGEILVDPSVVATIPKLVSRDELDRANGRLTTVEVVTNQYIGAPVGTAMFTVVPWLPFFVNALTYSSSIAAFRALPPDEQRQKKEQTSVRSEMGVGLRWILDHPFLKPLTAGIAIFHLGTAGAFGLLVVIVEDELDASPFFYGVALAAAAAGATVASLIAARLVERFSRRSIITTSATLAALSIIAIGGVTNIWQLIAAWAINGAVGGILIAIGRGFVQRHTPNDRLGRTAIASRMITRSSFVVGALLAGLVAETLSLRFAYVVAGTFHLVGALFLWRSFRFETTKPAQF